MPALSLLRRGRLAGAIIPAAAIAVAGIVVAQGGAQASARAPALHLGPKVSLGTTPNVFANAFADLGPNGVFYSRGSVVYVVHGSHAPKVALHAGQTVLALAGTGDDLFVQTGLTVTMYSINHLTKMRHWTLTSPVKPITTAGLYAVGGTNTVWSWTDWATDGSGFEYATVSRIIISSPSVHVVSKLAYPGAMAANSSGLFFESQGKNGSGNYLSHALSSGHVQSSKTSAANGTPITLTGSRIDLLAFGSSAKVHVNSYSQASLALKTSKQVFGGDDSLADPDIGLLVLSTACTPKCAAPVVSVLNDATGAASGGVRVPGTEILLPGPYGLVVEVSHGSHGSMTLQRITS
jgi:hypothetical protein